MKYQDLTPEQKESINPELRKLLEERDKRDYCSICGRKILFKNNKKLLCNFCFESIKVYPTNLNYKKLRELINKRNKKTKIKGFQEGLKEAIKIIDEEIKFLKSNFGICCDKFDIKDGIACLRCLRQEERIEELKKQKEHLEFEIDLE